MPLSPTAASTTVGSPSPFTFSCSVASSDNTLSVFDVGNKPANGHHYDDSTLTSVHYSRPAILPRSVIGIIQSQTIASHFGSDTKSVMFVAESLLL